MFEIERTNERARFVQIDLVNIEEKMLDFEYGVNTGNRFLQFVDHDEEPEAFIAAQTKSDSASNVPVPAATTMKKKSTTNKENLTSKTSNERRANATTVFNDQQNQSTRQDSTRGSRGAGRRAATNSARSQRFQKFDGTSNTNDESSSTRARRGRGAMSNRTATHSSQAEPVENDLSPQDRSFEPDSNRRVYRGNARPRVPREGTEMSQEDYRQNRRLHDRQPRNNVSSVKPIEKKDGEGAHNWGNPTENPEDHLVTEDPTETTAPVVSWAQQVDEAEKQMTLDEYKKQLEEKKRAQVEKLPQFKTRAAGEGEDPKVWTKPVQVYRKKNNADQSGDEDDDDEEGSDIEEQVSEDDDDDDEQLMGKKRLINIPLRFKPIETGRGARRTGNPRYRERNEQNSTDESRRSQDNAHRPTRQARNGNETGTALALDDPRDFPKLSN